MGLVRWTGHEAGSLVGGMTQLLMAKLVQAYIPLPLPWLQRTCDLVLCLFCCNLKGSPYRALQKEHYEPANATAQTCCC